MTSTAARMDSPTLIPTTSPGAEEKVRDSDKSHMKKQPTQSVELLTKATPVTPASGSTTTNNPNKTSPSSAKALPSAKTNDGATSVSPAADVIDSALLAALRDPRERLGLLKLEQNLIDFLEKQPQDLYVDIGGPYNSTVISPTLGYIGQQPQQLQAMAMAQGQPDGTNAGRPQTTFQRCILHRICDRFNMTRENSYTTDIYGCYLIRVCKGPDSKKPPRRLLNVKESEYQVPRPSPDNTNGTAASNNPNQQLTSSFQEMNLSSTGSGVPPMGTIQNNSSLSSKGGSKVRKMKIMKRSSSNVSNGSSGSNNSKAKNNSASVKTRSTLSEKERKYAEARARIFEQDDESGSGNGNGNPSASASAYNNSIVTGTTGVGLSTNNNVNSRYHQGNQYNNNHKNAINNDVNPGYSHTERRGSYNNYSNTNSYNQNRQSSHSPSSSSSAPGTTTGNPKAPLHNTSTTSLNSMSSNTSGKGSSSDGDQQQQQQQQQQLNNTRSKATYRNRQQEETDPDFRRGAGIQLQTNPYSNGHTAVGYGTTGSGRGAGNVYYPNNSGVANGNTSNRVGYGYAQQQQQQQHYQYQYSQQNYSASQQQQQQQQAKYHYSTVGGRGQAYPNMQYQHQRRQHEQHYPALSSSTTRK